jgi:hypothetical protein
MAKRIRCDQCQLLRINGLVCHEIGCPVAFRDEKRVCKNCDRTFKPKEQRQVVCSKRCYREYWG